MSKMTKENNHNMKETRLPHKISKISRNELRKIAPTKCQLQRKEPNANTDDLANMTDGITIQTCLCL